MLLPRVAGALADEALMRLNPAESCFCGSVAVLAQARGTINCRYGQ